MPVKDAGWRHGRAKFVLAQKLHYRNSPVHISIANQNQFQLAWLMGNLDYRGLAVLDAVASTGSFEKAALALGISQSAVSQRIKALEDATGRLLVIRGTPSVPTGLGQRLVVHHRHVKLMEASLDIDLGREPSLP